MTRSRVLWFLSVLLLATPILLATFGRHNGLTVDVWGNSLVVAAGIATANALVWGKREAEQ